MYIAVDIEKNEMTKLISTDYVDMMMEIDDDTSFVYFVSEDMKTYALSWIADGVDVRSIDYWEIMQAHKASIR